MDNNIVPFPAPKRVRAISQPIPKPAPAQWVCSKCQLDTFHIHANGHIHCTGCGALMRNLFARSGK